MVRISPSEESLGHNKFVRLQNGLCLLLILLVEREKNECFLQIGGGVFSPQLVLELTALQGGKYTPSIKKAI